MNRKRKSLAALIHTSAVVVKSILWDFSFDISAAWHHKSPKSTKIIKKLLDFAPGKTKQKQTPKVGSQVRGGRGGAGGSGGKGRGHADGDVVAPDADGGGGAADPMDEHDDNDDEDGSAGDDDFHIDDGHMDIDRYWEVKNEWSAAVEDFARGRDWCHRSRRPHQQCPVVP